MRGFLILSVLTSVLSSSVFLGTAIATEGWILWEKNNGNWLIVDGYPSYGLCSKAQSADLKGWESDPNFKAKIYWSGSEIVMNDDTIIGYYCLPSEFHPHKSE